METTMDRIDKQLERTLVGGSSTEALTGAAAVVLAILGLAQIVPRFMVSVASIVLGVGMIFFSAMIGVEYSRILARTGEGTTQKVEFSGGISSEVIGGIAAVVLGVLALLNLMPITLTSIAAIVLGATLVFSGGVLIRLNSLKIEMTDAHRIAKQVARDSMLGAIGTEVLVGLAAIVLGILALVGFNPMTLTLVAMLAVGASMLLTGSALVGRTFSAFSTP